MLLKVTHFQWGTEQMSWDVILAACFTLRGHDTYRFTVVIVSGRKDLPSNGRAFFFTSFEAWSFFHIKKKSIIISIVLVKFLTIVRWMYKIPSERGHKSTSTTHQRVREAIHCGNCSLASSGQKIGWICTHKASEINDCNLLWHLSFLYDE